MKPRLITPDAEGLPEDFHVIAGARDVFDAVEQMWLAFMEHPAISLVVWPQAPVLFHEADNQEKQEALKAAVHQLSAGARDVCHRIGTDLVAGIASLFTIEDDFLERKVAHHFEDIAVATGAPVSALQDWRVSTQLLAEALEISLTARKLVLSTCFQAATHHLDDLQINAGLRSNALRVLRAVDGEAAYFYGRDDVAAGPSGKGTLSASLKAAAQPWALNPWDIAFISQKAVHQAPAGRAAARCALEIYDVRSAEEFIAGAERPFFRRLFRSPPYADLDMLEM